MIHQCTVSVFPNFKKSPSFCFLKKERKKKNSFGPLLGHLKITRPDPFTSPRRSPLRLNGDLSLSRLVYDSRSYWHRSERERAKRREWRRTQRYRFGVRPVWPTSPTPTSARVWYEIAWKSLTRRKPYPARRSISPSPSGPTASLRSLVSSFLILF